MLDPKIYYTHTWDQIVELCEKQSLNTAGEIVQCMKWIRDREIYDPYPYDIVKTLDWYSKYKEDIEKYLLLM